MAVKIIGRPPAQSIAQDKPEPLPWEPDHQSSEPVLQTVPEALSQFDKGSGDKLFLVSNDKGEQFQVLDWDSKTRRAVLVGPFQMRLNPVIGEREASRYHALWRKK